MAKTTTRYERGPTPIGLHSKPLPSRPNLCKPSAVVISAGTLTPIDLTGNTNPAPLTRHNTIDLDLELKIELKAKTKTKPDPKAVTNLRVPRIPRPRRTAHTQSLRANRRPSPKPTLNLIPSPYNSPSFPDGPLFKTNLTAHNLPHLPIGHSNLFTYLYYPSVYERVALGLPRWHDAVKTVEEWEGKWEKLELEMEIDIEL